MMKRINRKPQKANRAKIRDFYSNADKSLRESSYDDELSIQDDPIFLRREFENTDRFFIQNSIRLNYWNYGTGKRNFKGL